MKKLLLASIAGAAIGIVSSANAADLAARPYTPYTKAPPMMAAPIYDWTGFYLGGHLGGAFRGSGGNVLGGGKGGSFMGGGQIGWDNQFAPNWVFGLEANYSFLDTAGIYKNRGLGSVTGRLGYTWGPSLLYVKGGYGWADSRFTNGFTGSAGRSGYTVGGGLEYMFTPNWSGKIEYQYYDFGTVNYTTPAAAVGSFRNSEQTIKVGLNYRFNWGLAGPSGY
jgi:outer membrane immunogenic protein